MKWICVANLIGYDVFQLNMAFYPRLGNGVGRGR